MIEHLTGSDVLKFRKKNNISRAELATAISSNATTIYNWERGKSSPHLVVRKKFLHFKQGYEKKEFSAADFKALKKKYRFSDEYVAKLANITFATVNRFSSGKKVHKLTAKLICETVNKLKSEINPSFDVPSAVKRICNTHGREFLMKEFNVSKNTIYCWQSGRRKPIFTDMLKLQKIAEKCY